MVRALRSKQHDLAVTSVESTHDGFIFEVCGTEGDIYLVECFEDVSLWPPTCNCLDNSWRPDLNCKHILYCLRLMGVSENALADLYFEPSQYEMYEILMHAYDVCAITQRN